MVKSRSNILSLCKYRFIEYSNKNKYRHKYKSSDKYIYEIWLHNCCRALMDTAAVVWAGKSLVRFISAVELVLIVFTLSPSHYNTS